MSTPKSKRGRKRKTVKGDDPSEINRSFSVQARDRFSVLFAETVRHLDGLSLTFTESGDGIVPVSKIKSEFSRVFHARMDKLVHDIEAQENTTRDGNFGQNPKEKWGVFQEDVDGMVRCMYEFIEWASGSMTKDPLGQMYIIAELLDGIFGAVWSSKQGLKHVWNKGILDKKQDFFCLAKILEHFPHLEHFCDDVARNRLGPDRNTSWTEVVQDLRNIRLRTVAAFVQRQHVNTQTTKTDVATYPASLSSGSSHRSSAPPALIPYVKEVTSQPSIKQEPTHQPAPGSLFPSDRRGSRDGNYAFDEPKDTSMEDVTEQLTNSSQSKAELSLPLPPRPSPEHAFGRYPVFSEMSGTLFSSTQKISTNEPLLVPMSYSIPQGSQEFDRHCSAVPLASPQNSSLPPRVANHECFQHPLRLDRNTLQTILNDPTDFDFDMEDFDDNEKCIFDIGPNMATMLTSVEELKLAALAADGKLSNGSI